MIPARLRSTPKFYPPLTLQLLDPAFNGPSRQAQGLRNLPGVLPWMVPDVGEQSIYSAITDRKQRNLETMRHGLEERRWSSGLKHGSMDADNP